MWPKSWVILVCSLAFWSAISFSQAIEIGLNDIDTLLKNATIISLRKYSELPDADNFFTNDAYVLSAAKYVNYSDYLLSFFNSWDENELNRQFPRLSLSFGLLSEKLGRDNRQVDSKPNLRRFLKIRDDYPEETRASFRTPQYLRELFNMPTILDCDYMLDKYHDSKFEFYLNYESYEPIKNNVMDRLSCALKGQAAAFIIDEGNLKLYENYKKNEKSMNLSEIRYHQFPIEAGQCVFFPSTLTTFIKADYLWLSTIEWEHIDKPVRFSECYPSLPPREPKIIYRSDDDLEAEVDKEEEEDDEEKPTVNHRLMSQFRYATDAEEQKAQKELNHLYHFLKYFTADNQAYTQQEFIVKIKKDSKFVKDPKSCDNECNRLIKKTFLDLDIDKDDSFQIEDFESLDEESAQSTNKKIEHTLELLRGGGKKSNTAGNKNNAKSSDTDGDSQTKSKIYNLDLGTVKIPIDLGPLEQVGKTFKMVLDAIQSNNMMGSVKTILWTKFMEMAKNLPADKRAKLEAINFAEIAEILGSMVGAEQVMKAAAQAAQYAADSAAKAKAKENEKSKKSDDDDDDDDDEEEVSADDAAKRAKEDL